MSKDIKKQYRYTQNRELSWLRFNRRVLEEGDDISVPPLERLKFISIFSNNLDEFFMVRVGSIFDLACMTPDDTDNKTGWRPDEQLKNVYRAIPGLLALKKRIYTTVMKELENYGIRDLSMNELNSSELKKVNRFFNSEVLPILSPILIGTNHPVPHLINKNLYTAALLEDKKGHRSVGMVPVPASLPPYFMLSDGKSFVRTENILLQYMPELFGAYSVKESCVICVTRNADINLDDEKFEDDEKDFRSHMKKLLKKREHLGVIRLELGKSISADFSKKLADMVKIDTHRVFTDTCPLNMSYVFNLTADLSKTVSARLVYQPYKGRWPEDLSHDDPIIEQIQIKDRLLFYPYDSVEPFLKLLNEAADNPNVLSIKITVYRLASSSKIAQTLCRAANNGKEVLVLMELRARFDEANNLAWSEMLEDSGCQVIYGAEGFKCHSKICLITIRNRNRTSYITQIGTGNYNEKTNAMYTDLSLMSADKAIGEDAAAFFRNMPVNQLNGNYNHLCVSPGGIKQMILDNIDRQISLGEDGYICIKANSVTERDVIDRLALASQSGVEVQLIIRGICCILPGVCGYTDNIHVTAVVGRFLEHARVYCFGRGDNTLFYISSADLMTRNLNRRVEIACPVYDEQLREQLKWLIVTQLHDTKKASELLPDGSYLRKYSVSPFDSQDYFTQETFHKSTEPIKKSFRILHRLKKICFFHNHAD